MHYNFNNKYTIIILIASFIVAVVVGLILAPICSNILKDKGYPDSKNNGGLFGFFLGLIGLVICTCMSPYNGSEIIHKTKEDSISVADELLKYKQLLDTGAITQEEYDKKKQELLKQ